MAWCSKCKEEKKKINKKKYVMFLGNCRGNKKIFKKGLNAMPMVFKKK